MLSWEFPPRVIGGLARHVAELSHGLSQEGVECHILTPKVDGAPNFENVDGAYIYRIGTPFPGMKNFKAWTYSFNVELIKNSVLLNSYTRGFDLIHAHDWLVAYSGRVLAKMFRIPLVSTIHATEHGRNMGLHNRMQKEIHDTEFNLVSESDRVICCSNYMKQEILDLFQTTAERIAVIPNGVNPVNLSKRHLYGDLRVPGLESDDRIIFFIGRLVPEKGIDTLIRAFGRVADQIPDGKLVIGGRGPQEKDLRKLAESLGLSDRVVFTGFISDRTRDRLLHWAEAAVFPSTYEPFGIVALEAMAAGTPVIVSNVGGLAEIIEDGYNGRKIEAGDVNGLAAALLNVLQDPEMAARLRSQAYQDIEARYTWRRIAVQTAAVYQEALGEVRRREVS